jgi:hypothetical protein
VGLARIPEEAGPKKRPADMTLREKNSFKTIDQVVEGMADESAAKAPLAVVLVFGVRIAEKESERAERRNREISIARKQ